MSCYCACRLTIKPVCFVWVNTSIDDGALRGSVIKDGGITSGTTKNQRRLRRSQHLYIQRKHSQHPLIRHAGKELLEMS